MSEVLAEWIRKALADSRTAHRELEAEDEPNFDAACYHAQQCAVTSLRKLLNVFVVLATLLMCSVGALSAGGWDKHVASDRSYSFHYPAGWAVTPDDSIVEVSSGPTDEQLLMVGVPFSQRKTPTQLAADFVALLKAGNPNTRALNWQTSAESKDSEVVFDLTDEVGATKYDGMGMLIKSGQQATWFSYVAPTAVYSRARAAAILQGFVGSLELGVVSKAPAVEYPGLSAGSSSANSSTTNSGTVGVTSDAGSSRAIRIASNAQAFLFVLEFALGAPLTQAQEQVILGELKSGWSSQSDAELKSYDQYPPLVQTILKMGQKDLEALRGALEKSVTEWIADSDQSDKAVLSIRTQLQLRGRVLTSGDPPLTEMSLTAYSEIVAFSRLLRQNAQAQPGQVSQAAVQEARSQALKAWASMSKDDKLAISGAPGVWICMRTLLVSGSDAEKAKVRGELLKVSAGAVSGPGGASAATGGGQTAPMSMASHASLMAIQQMTFNTYMWSRGFNYTPAAGKMW